MSGASSLRTGSVAEFAQALLVTDLTITAATAYFQGIGRRTETDQDAQVVSSHRQFLTGRTR